MKKFIVIIFVLISSNVYKENSMSAEIPDKAGISKFVLNNGMTVILQENSSAPVTAVNVWVKTGSTCETEEERGLAHVHEHMLFKGTKKYAVGEIAKTIEGGGGDINAYTSFDETVYYVVSASRFLPSTLDILADVMQNSTFDPTELTKELEVVQEEIRRGEDTPGRVLSQKLFSTAYEKHPYRNPIIGTKESVNSFNRKKVLNFYNKWYTPQNMVLVVVGDFKTKKLKPVIEKTFGKLKKRQFSECKIPAEPTQKKIKTFVIDKDINVAHFAIAFHVPDIKHEDTPAIDVISSILSGGESSRLIRKIKEEMGLVNSIYSYAFTPKHSGIFLVGGNLQADKATSAVEAIMEQIYRLKYVTVSNDELKKAKVNIESDFIYSMETMQGQAQKLGSFEVDAGDYQYEMQYIDKISRVTPDKIKQVANRYFIDSNITAGLLLPSNQKTVTEKQLKNTIVNKTRRVESEHNKKTETSDTGKTTRKILNNGIRVLIKENHSVPIFSARAVFLGGIRYETESTNGLSYFTSEMFTRGTVNRTSEEIALEIDSLAGELEGFSGRNSFGVSVETLSKNFSQTMKLFSDVVLNPSFPEQEVERARRIIISRIKKQEDNLLRKSINLFLKSLYVKHPYRFNVLGSMENVKKFSSKNLKDFYKNSADPSNLVISVVGNVNTRETMEAIEKYFGSMKGSEDFTNLTFENEERRNDIKKEIIYEKDKLQTHIVLGFLGPTLYDRDYYAFQVLNSILAGQGGRLFIQLRDKKSMAYSVTSFLRPGIESGYFGIYIGTSPDKEQEAINEIKKEIVKLLEHGVTDEELNRAKNYLVGSFEIALQQNSAQAARIAFDEIYGIGWNDYTKYPKKILAVTKNDVIKTARKFIDLNAYTLAIVKNRDDG